VRRAQRPSREVLRRAQPPLRGEHGEHGEHWTLMDASTVPTLHRASGKAKILHSPAFLRLISTPFSPEELVAVIRACFAVIVVLGAAGTCRAQQQAPHAAPTPVSGMRVDTWFGLGLSHEPSRAGRDSKNDMAPAQENAEQITVYARPHDRDSNRGAALRANDPVYEAGASTAAQPLVPYPSYTSPEQERLMSIKTDALGLCGALGGYIQCPNKSP
jgi:hypothetical protein